MELSAGIICYGLGKPRSRRDTQSSEKIKRTKITTMIKLIPAVNANDHIYGNYPAAIELVEYGDYECLYCGEAYLVVKDIQLQLGADMTFVFRNFPLAKIHPHATNAAVAAEAAGLQHKFWEMHDIIFENQQDLNLENVLRLADSIGLDSDRLKRDMQLIELIDKVRFDFESGMRSGVNKTPTFFVNGEKFDGIYSKDQLLHYLRSVLTSIIIS
jgi:protein-disulfide isomerase